MKTDALNVVRPSAARLDVHKMLPIIYMVLKNSRPHNDRIADYEALIVKRNEPLWIRMLRRYDYVEPLDAELEAA